MTERNQCWYCGEPAQQIDHVIPRYAGGNSKASNLVPVCKWCNKSKRHYPLEEWRKKMGLRHGMSFTEAQREYWTSVGVELPQDAKYLFFFELQGWTL